MLLDVKYRPQASKVVPNCVRPDRTEMAGESRRTRTDRLFGSTAGYVLRSAIDIFRIYLNYLYFNVVRYGYLQAGVLVPYIALAPSIVAYSSCA